MTTLDYREALKPNGPYLSLLHPRPRKFVELLAQTYTRDEIAEMFAISSHNVAIRIHNARTTLHVSNDIELILLAYGLLDGRECFGLNLSDAWLPYDNRKPTANRKCPTCKGWKSKEAQLCRKCAAEL